MTQFLPVSAPFSLEHTLYSGQAFRWREHEGWHYGIVGGNLVKIRQTKQGLEWESSPAPTAQLTSAIHSYFRLGDDLDEVYRHIGRDSRIREAIARYRGMHLIEQDPWECLVAFLCSINSNIPRITDLLGLLSRKLGQSITLGDVTLYAFPMPEDLASLGESGLRRLGLGFRASYIDIVANAVARGELNLASLKELPYEQAKAGLMMLRGIGDKVADCVLLFSLGKLEAFPIDRWVRRAVQEWYFNGAKLSDQAIHQWALDYFGPYAGYAQQYLFYSRRSLGKGRAALAEP